MRDKGKRLEDIFESRNGFHYIKVKGMTVTMVVTFGPNDRIQFSIEPYLDSYSVVPHSIIQS